MKEIMINQFVPHEIEKELIRFTRWCINVGYIMLENGSWGRAGYNPNYRLSDYEVINQWSKYKSQNP